jgi:hypothetical protein
MVGHETTPFPSTTLDFMHQENMAIDAYNDAKNKKDENNI